MGGKTSKPAKGSAPVEAQPVPQQSTGGKRKPASGKDKKFQIMLSGDWKNYEKQEDTILKKAYLVGHPNCKFSLRGQKYEYNFKTMKQVNLGTSKERQIRPPPGFKPPAQALLPSGPMTVITVKPGQAGKTIEIPDPNNKKKKIQVNVPSGAKPGQKMAVPLPAAGESAQDAVEKQKKHSTGAKLAMGTAGIAAAGGAVLGGVILGDHLTGGTLGVSEAAADYAGEAVDWVEGAADAAPGVAEDAVDWAEGAAGDAGDWIEGAAEDAGDWLGDAADDTGDFIMSLF
jgi:hypothetical protein